MRDIGLIIAYGLLAVLMARGVLSFLEPNCEPSDLLPQTIIPFIENREPRP